MNAAARRTTSWKQFTLRAGLVAITLCAVLLGVGRRRWQQKMDRVNAPDALAEALGSLSNPRISREQLLVKFHVFQRRFPPGPLRRQAQETTRLLERMVAEDEAHAKSAKSLDEMTVNERVAELIFQLREQPGDDAGFNGRRRIFSHWIPKAELTPADQLVRLRYDAVPQLTEALDDRRLTRVWTRLDYGNMHMFRVGDCARAVLERIAGKTFYEPHDYVIEMIQAGAVESTREAVLAWWSQIQTKGPKQALIAFTSAGDQDSPAQAARLAQWYPDAAIDAVIAGARNAKELNPRGRLVRIAGDLPGDKQVPFLLDEMRNGLFLGTRVTAAEGLRRRKHPSALPAMIEEWHRSKLKRPEHQDAWDDFEQLLQFLIGSRDAAAIAELGRRIGDAPAGVRYTLVSAFATRPPQQFTRAYGSTSWPVGVSMNIQRNIPRSNDEAVNSAVRRLLVSLMDDTEAIDKFSGKWDGKWFTDPRICDVAAHVLQQRWPDTYQFDLDAPLAVRERQRARLKATEDGP